MHQPASERGRRIHTRILDQLSAYLELAEDEPVLELRREQVSQWSVAEHMEHIARSDASILDVLEGRKTQTVPKGARAKPLARLLLAIGFIPRGRARAPAFVEPRDPQPAALRARLERAHARFTALGDDLARLQCAALARHFAFGYLDGVQWLRFVNIHQHHHWKIIRDIRRARR